MGTGAAGGYQVLGQGVCREVCQPRAICQAGSLEPLASTRARQEQPRLSREGAEVTLGLCGVAACASLAGMCTGRGGAPALPTTIMLALSTCSGRSGSCSRTRPGRTGVNCDLSSGICAEVDVCSMPLVEIRSAHISGAAGPDAQEGPTSVKAASSAFERFVFL